MNPRAGLLLSLIAFSCLTAGCAGARARFLNLIGLSKPPLVVAVSAPARPPEESLALLNPYAEFEPLRKDLEESLARPVALETCFPALLAPHLKSGFYDLAFLSAEHYQQLARDTDVEAIAVSSDLQGRVERPAVLIVPQHSPIRAPEDLRGKVVAFGRRGDLRTHIAALRWLESAGLSAQTLSLEVLPVPGLKHLPTGKSVAASVVHGSSHAGFIDLQDWESLPPRTETTDVASRENLRIVAYTEPVPEQLVVCSPKMPARLVESIRTYLLKLNRTDPEVPRLLAISGFATPTEELLATCRMEAPSVPSATKPSAPSIKSPEDPPQTP